MLSSPQAVAWLRVLCNTLKIAAPAQLLHHWSTLYRILGLVTTSLDPAIACSTMRCKLAGRLAFMKMRKFSGDVPAEVEVVLQDLLELLGANVCAEICRRLRTILKEVPFFRTLSFDGVHLSTSPG